MNRHGIIGRDGAIDEGPATPPPVQGHPLPERVGLLPKPQDPVFQTGQIQTRGHVPVDGHPAAPPEPRSDPNNAFPPATTRLIRPQKPSKNILLTFYLNVTSVPTHPPPGLNPSNYPTIPQGTAHTNQKIFSQNNANTDVVSSNTPK